MTSLVLSSLFDSPNPWFPPSVSLFPSPVSAEVEAGVEAGAEAEAEAEAEAVVAAGVMTGVATAPEVTTEVVGVAKVFGVGISTVVVVLVFKVFVVEPICPVPGTILVSGMTGVMIPGVPMEP